MNMELEDLRQAWEAQGSKVDANSRLNSHVLHQAITAKAETATRRLSRLLWIDLLINLTAAAWLGSFLAGNVTVARYAIPAAALDVLVIALLMAGVRQLVALSRVDYGQPVLAIQKRMESLRAERIRATMVTLVVAPLAWIPMLIVVLQGLFGVDVYATFSSAWLIANVVFGLLVVAVAVWASRRYAGRVTSSPSLRWLMDNLAGRNLQTATAFLHSLAKFDEAGG
jgi:hypothetical protein